MITIAEQLATAIERAKMELMLIEEHSAAEKPGSDKWSYKEILGHLIDSASTNHQRIVRMQENANIGKFTYDQEHWVTSQHYHQEPWVDLVQLWYFYNKHLAQVIAHVRPAALNNVCDIDSTKPATLRFVIEDYLQHMRHHLQQIVGKSVDPAQ